MPTYQYACKSCGHQFETHQTYSAAKLRDCPECAESELERLISGGAGYFVKDSGVLPDAKPKPKSSSKKEDPKPKEKEEPGHHHHGHHHCHHHHH